MPHLFSLLITSLLLTSASISLLLFFGFFWAFCTQHSVGNGVLARGCRLADGRRSAAGKIILARTLHSIRAHLGSFGCDSESLPDRLLVFPRSVRKVCRRQSSAVGLAAVGAGLGSWCIPARTVSEARVSTRMRNGCIRWRRPQRHPLCRRRTTTSGARSDSTQLFPQVSCFHLRFWWRGSG